MPELTKKGSGGAWARGRLLRGRRVADEARGNDEVGRGEP